MIGSYFSFPQDVRIWFVPSIDLPNYAHLDPHVHSYESGLFKRDNPFQLSCGCSFLHLLFPIHWQTAIPRSGSLSHGWASLSTDILSLTKGRFVSPPIFSSLSLDLFLHRPCLGLVINRASRVSHLCLHSATLVPKYVLMVLSQHCHLA